MTAELAKLTELTHKVLSEEEDFEIFNEGILLLLEKVADGFWDWDIASNGQFMSRKFWEILGRDPDQTPNTAEMWQSCIHPDETQITLESISDYLAKGGVGMYSRDVRYVKPSGEIVVISCQGKVIEWSDGKPSRMIGLHCDITADKEKRGA